MAKVAAVILSGGTGKRMRLDIPKQYMEIHGKPLIFYTLRAFEESCVDEVVLVTGREDVQACRKNIIEKFGFQKVTAVTAGGRERYDSVYEGLLALKDCDYVLIHDGARACVTAQVIADAVACVKKYDAAVAAVPVKDTIKQATVDGFVANTPDRSTLWQIQTPQAFVYTHILSAYKKMYDVGNTDGITDDAMVMEQFGNDRIKLFMADYNNMKVTTPEDIPLVSRLLAK
jgi:2-C-methyl-D-erythritol 4-phosphate cytidylyltransferase